LGAGKRGLSFAGAQSPDMPHNDSLMIVELRIIRLIKIISQASSSIHATIICIVANGGFRVQPLG
jgi:hypothetical protein